MDSTTLEGNSSTVILSMSNTPSTTSLDQVSSLREAALSSLRAKRRKPGVEKMSISRPPPPQSIQLDYGQEEDSTWEPQPPTQHASPATVNQHVAKQPDPASEDVQMREEGEISEEEDILPISQVPKETHKPSTEDVQFHSIKPIAPARAYSATSQELSQSATQSRRSSEQSLPSPRPRSGTPTTRLSAAHLTLLSLDAGHVRPGLQMTQQQYETAKDIILDLLGWGVPPEYLVECGLSRELVFYVFAELNLRLPRNLDTTGLIPYTPETVTSAHQAAASVVQEEVQAPSSDLQSSSVVKTGKDASPQPKPAKSSSSPPAESPISPSNLHDIEMQRRQELLARKRAALASRKSNQFPSNLVSVPQADTATSEPTSAASADVDSFLKSISTPTAVDASVSTAPSDRAASLSKPDDAMDVDDVPGLREPPAAQPSMSPANRASQSTPSTEEQSPSATPPCDISQSLTGSLPPSIEKSDSVSSADSSVSVTREHSYQFTTSESQARRGARRPVASDFVDLDTNARLPTFNGSHYNQGSMHHTSFTRRKVGTIDFGTVNNGHRRCVIDLSDSEDETEEWKSEHNQGKREKRSPFNSPGPSTPPVIPVASASAPPGLTKEPSQLEMEIQRMKELIAKKEQDRLKKLASRAQNLLDSPVVNPAPPKIKQEEVDHSLHSKSPVMSHKLDGRAPPMLNDSEVYHESSDSSIASVAAALASTSTSTSASTTPAIGDNGFTVNPQDADIDNRAVGSEQAEDVVMQNVVTEQTPKMQDEQSKEHVDADVDMSSSAQDSLGLESSKENAPEFGYSTYASPLASYPLLRIHPQVSSMDIKLASEPQSNNISASLSKHLSPAPDPILISNDQDSPRSFRRDAHFPDLKLLKLASAAKYLDPLKRICQFEIPGGGVCRDEKCEDIHLSRLANTIGGSSDHQTALDWIDANDEDTAEYLFHNLPSEWRHQRKIKEPAEIKSVLAEVRLQKTGPGEATLEERVRRALAALEPPPSYAPPE